jgi:hypothetical protein
MSDDERESPWVSRFLNLNLQRAHASFVTRFLVDFRARMPAHDDDDFCCARHGREDCWKCYETSRHWQCLVRLAVGPATRDPGRPDRRGLRLDAWMGTSTESGIADGKELDTCNEVVIENGDTVFLKIPELEGFFPGLGIYIEWPLVDENIPVPNYPLLVMPTQPFPTHTMLVSRIGTARTVDASCPCCRTSIPMEFVPKAPPSRARPRAADPPAPPPSKRARTRAERAASRASIASALGA